MSTQIHTEPSVNQEPEVTKGIAFRITDVAKDTTNDAKGVAHQASEKAKVMYHSAAVKAEETLTTSKDYVRRNPVPVVLGAVALGAAIGYTLMKSLRKPTFSERYSDEPMSAVREAILSALTPVTQRVHHGYGSAREGAEKAIDQLQRYSKKHSSKSVSNRLGRIGDNLKFW